MWTPKTSLIKRTKSRQGDSHGENILIKSTSKTFARFLYDAKKEKNGAFLHGAGKDGWLLTESDVLCEGRVDTLEHVDLSHERLSAKDAVAAT